MVTMLKRRVTKPWERTRVTGDRRGSVSWAGAGTEPGSLGISEPQVLSCKMGMMARSLHPYAVGTDKCDKPFMPPPGPGLEEALGKHQGPASTTLVCMPSRSWHLPVCFPGACPAPPRPQPACGRRGGAGELSFTFSAFTLSHHLGIRVLRPPSHEPAGKIGEHGMNKTLAGVPDKCWMCQQSSPRLGPGQTCPTPPALSQSEGQGQAPAVVSMEARGDPAAPLLRQTPACPSQVRCPWV